MNHELEARYIDDGIYEVPEGIVVQQLLDQQAELYDLTAEHPEVKEFAVKYPDFRIASSYETHVILLLSGEPVRWNGNRIGSGFNYGSTNFLEGCSPRMLILAEND